MTYKFDAPQFAGYPPIEAIFPAPAAATPYRLPVPAGLIATAEDPVFGPGEFIFARANGSIRQYGLCVLTPVWDATNKVFQMNMTECPNTANLGRPVYVAQCQGALTSGQYAWFLNSGVTPIYGTASVAADMTFGITAAGQVGANSAGKQIVNARVVTPATQTVVTAVVGAGAAIGERVIPVQNTQGLFVGGYVAGTGIPAGASIVAIDQVSSTITISADLTAAAAGNVTQTANNATIFYNIAHLDRAFAQGAIT